MRANRYPLNHFRKKKKERFVPHNLLKPHAAGTTTSDESWVMFQEHAPPAEWQRVSVAVPRGPRQAAPPDVPLTKPAVCHHVPLEEDPRQQIRLWGEPSSVVDGDDDDHHHHHHHHHGDDDHDHDDDDDDDVPQQKEPQQEIQCVLCAECHTSLTGHAVNLFRFVKVWV